MAITNIQVNFTPCVPAPGGGYNIVYRVVGDPSYTDAGNYMTSPADIGVSYPDGTFFEGIVHSPCGDVVWSTVPIASDCGCRFAYPGEDELAGEIRAFEQAGFRFTFFDGGTDATLILDPSNGAYQLGKNIANGAYFSANAVSNSFTAQAGNASYITMDAVANIFHVVMMGGFDHLNLDAGTGVYEIGDISAFGVGNNNFIRINDTAQTAFFRVANFAGAAPGDVLTLIDTATGEAEWQPGTGGGSGGAMMRFGYPTEDDTAGEDRIFNVGTLYQVVIGGLFDSGVKDSIFKVVNESDNGTAIYAVSGPGVGGIAIRAESVGVAGSFTSIDDVAINASSTNGLGALITSANNLAAEISTYTGSYSLDARTTTTIDNDQVHPNLLLGAYSTITPVADGFGQSLDFRTNTLDPTTVRISNQFISRWTIADDTTGQSELKITGVAAGALWDLISIQGDGIFVFLQGLFDYADDTAAAAGTPIIPIGGLYRTGNAVQIRLT